MSENQHQRVFVTRAIPAEVLTRLGADFDLVVRETDELPTRAELLAGVSGAHGMIAMVTDRIDDELFDAAGTQLACIANFAVGYDNVDVPAATRRGIVVTNTPGVLSPATAEFTVALMLALTRRVVEADQLLRSRTPWWWSPTWMLGPGLRGRRLGIVGMGRIGREVAQLAEAFAMDIVYAGRSRRADVLHEHVSFDELLRTSHVVSLHCPLTPETRHLIGADELRRMRDDAVLINTARGPVIDESALVRALQTGVIAGAALDVFEHEPAVHDGLASLGNVVLTPHIGSSTQLTRQAMGDLCASALCAVLLERRTPPNAINADGLE
ncbi:MAG: D-glycerate dehydrogenase [Actinomycetia bacterium]|nr:D-glycerate dehydrogenase [Actinomycetes bacterium]